MFSNRLSCTNWLTLKKTISLFLDPSGPWPQNLSGTSFDSTARQKAETAEAGVEKSTKDRSPGKANDPSLLSVAPVSGPVVSALALPCVVVLLL